MAILVFLLVIVFIFMVCMEGIKREKCIIHTSQTYNSVNLDMHKRESKKRLYYLDIARGISILCIIIGHLSEMNINRVVFTFHVPMFFLITGYFIPEEDSIKKYIKSKIRSLIVPYCITCLVIIILGTISGYVSAGLNGAKISVMEWMYAALYGSGNTYMEPFYIKSIGAIWFLLATFWGGIFLKCLLRLKSIERLSLVIILFLVGYLSREYFWFPLSLQAGCCSTLFMYIGHLFKNYHDVLKTVSLEVKQFIFVTAIIVWFFFIRDFKTFYLVCCDVGRGVVDIIGSLCACYVVINISRLIENKLKYLGIALAYIGRFSLFILCIHIVELTFFPWWEITGQLRLLGMPIALEIPLIIVGKFILNIFLMFLCSRSSIIRRLFGIKAIEKNK